MRSATLVDTGDTAVRPKLSFDDFIWTVLALVLPIYRTLPGSFKFAWVLSVVGLVLVSVVLQKVARPKYSTIWVIGGYAALVATITANLESSVSDNLASGVQLFVVLGPASYVLAFKVRSDARFLRVTCSAFVVSQLVSSSVALAQISGMPIGPAAVHGRAFGLAGHPNILGLFSAVAFLLCLHDLILHRRFRIYKLLACTALAGSILASGSLSALSAGLLGLLVLAIGMRRQLRVILLAGILGAFFYWLVSYVFVLGSSLHSPVDRYFQVTGQTGDISTLRVRQETFAYAWNKIQEHPLLGLGLTVSDSGTYDGTTQTHNLFLHAWYQGGVALALSVALILGAICIVILQTLRRGYDALNSAVLATIAVYAMTSAFFTELYYWLPLLTAWAGLRSSAVSNGRD